MIKLHLGCGWRNFGKDWIHIDGGDYNHLDYHNICCLPCDNESVDLIYASHVLEYFDREEVKNLLNEWNRVLKPGGILRIAVPDFNLLINVYEITHDLNKILGPLFGKMEMDNKKIYHKTVYDWKSICLLLNENEFKDVQKYDWRKTDHTQFDDHSQAYFPHMNKENGLLISLNVECTKI